MTDAQMLHSEVTAHAECRTLKKGHVQHDTTNVSLPRWLITVVAGGGKKRQEDNLDSAREEGCREMLVFRLSDGDGHL